MNNGRRTFLKLLGLAAGAQALAGCGSLYGQLAGLPPAPPPDLPGTAVEFQLLNRLTYGPRHTDRAQLADMGMPAWVEEQLAPDLLDDGPCDLRLRPLDSVTLDAASLFDLYGDRIFDDKDTDQAPTELRQATLLRQVYSRRQLYELLVEFWSDHFNISVEKGDCFYLKTVDDREVIRRHALDNFRDLLWASVHSPAMLVYLDNQANEKSHPNENYARELLELHSLGVDGGYSQTDVMELARCLTGWSVKERFWRGEFTFRADLHDEGHKRVLGMAIAPSGQSEAEQVVERLATHESTARFLVHKLARRFLGDAPPAALLQTATQAFQQTQGDIKAVLRVLLLDGLTARQPLPPKFKRPVNFVASALRQTHAETDGGAAIHAYLQRMGQLPFAWPTPDGFPDRDADWMANLLPRWQFALALVRNEIPGATVDLAALTAGHSTLPALIDRLSELFLGAPLPPPANAALQQSLAAATAEPATLLAASLLAAPAFQWR
ncbi:MAG: DUF1800 domain-containing protein [Caldilinea sp. CFX5]|nr:DUF1800 domain-containing protein [Caldilinea sp. CFX5]